jgi:hypothetical protein
MQILCHGLVVTIYASHFRGPGLNFGPEIGYIVVMVLFSLSKQLQR